MVELEGAHAGAAMNKDRRREVLRIVREQFQLDWHGIHGVPHWARVRWNGLNLAAVNGARTDIVELFAFLHDCRRLHVYAMQRIASARITRTSPLVPGAPSIATDRTCERASAG